MASSSRLTDQDLLKRLEQLDERAEIDVQTLDENAESDAIEDELIARGWRFTLFGWKPPTPSKETHG